MSGKTHIMSITKGDIHMSAAEFKLQKPLKLANGNEIDTLQLDYESLTMADLKTANRITKMIGEQSVEVDASVASPRLNSDLRIAIAWMAAIKGTQGVMVNDVLNISMVDALRLSEDAMGNYLFR